MQLRTYQDTLRYLYSFIPKTDMNRFPGNIGLERTKAFLAELGNPQERVSVVHIAGTSGKGSTATMIERILRAHGKRTGLHVKPHLIDIRERFQIDGALVPAGDFVRHVRYALPAIDKINSRGMGSLTYFEVLVSLAYTIFAGADVDYAIVETGVGGTFDGSNTVANPNKVAVITTIGYDHMQLLGTTLPEIASQKAGIIQPGNTAFVLNQPEVLEVFLNRAAAVGASVTVVDPGTVLREQRDGALEAKISHVSVPDVRLGLAGEYQRQNAALALAAVSYLAARDGFHLDASLVRNALATVSYPGRFDIRRHGKRTLVLDGAHNGQKIGSFMDSLLRLYPGKKFPFILAFKEGKEIDSMLAQIVPHASEIVLTDFFNNQTDFVSLSADVHAVAKLLESHHGYKKYRIVYSAAHSLDMILASMSEDPVVITGSLYFLSDVYAALGPLEK